MPLHPTPFVRVSFVIIVGVLGTALISPLYPVYKSSWNLQTSDISFIYVIYMGGALCSLLFLGRLPDKIGFKRMLLWGLALALTGSILTLISRRMVSLSIGRFIVGLASGMITTSGSLGLTVLAHKNSRHRIGMLIGVLIAAGFGVGPLLGGIIGEWVPDPLVTAHIPTIILVMVAIYATSKLQIPASAQDHIYAATPLRIQDFLPRLTWTEKSKSVSFILTCGLPFLAFGVFGMYASMSPLFLEKMMTWHGPFVSGASIAIILLASAFVQLICARLPTHFTGIYGLFCLAGSNALLLTNMRVSSAGFFIAGVILTAIGHGMCMLASMTVVNRIAQPHNRSGLLSTYLLVGYIGAILPMLGIDWIADSWGMTIAVSSFCIAVIIASTIWACFFALSAQIRNQ